MRSNEFLTEAAKPTVGRKYQHIEDLVLSNGYTGAMHAIERMRHMGEEGGTIELKWDGCVHEDSVILTSIGEMTIKEFVHHPDLKVTAFGKNLSSGEDCFSDVTHKTESLGVKDWVEVFFDNGSSIKLTEDHQVLTKNRGWVAAGQLEVTDEIVTSK